MYFDYSESVDKLPPHRILAMLRGEDKKVPFGFQSKAGTGTKELTDAISYSVYHGLGRSDALEGLTTSPVEFFGLDAADVRPDVVIGDNEQGIKTVVGVPGAIGYVSIGAAVHHATAGAARQHVDRRCAHAQRGHMRLLRRTTSSPKSAPATPRPAKATAPKSKSTGTATRASRAPTVNASSAGGATDAPPRYRARNATFR